MSWAARAGSAALGLMEPLTARWPAIAVYRLRMLVDGGQTERAILYGWRHLAGRPTHAWLHFQSGRAAQSKGLSRQARVRFAHAAALDPSEATFRFALGYALRQEGHLSAAAREYRVALREVPDEPKILFNLGVVERERKRFKAAQACFERVVSLWPKDVRAFYTLGVCAFEAGDQVTAMDSLRRAIERDPRHHKSHYQLALVHLDARRMQPAHVALRQTLRLKADYGPAHYALGRSLVDDDPGRARHHLRESLLTEPPMLRAHLDLGRLHQRAGRLEEARAEYMLFARHHPNRRKAWVKARLVELEAALRERRR